MNIQVVSDYILSSLEIEYGYLPPLANCFEIRLTNGIPFTCLTEKGTEFGIETELRVSEKGTEYNVFFYSEKAQRTMVQKLQREWLVQE